MLERKRSGVAAVALIFVFICLISVEPVKAKSQAKPSQPRFKSLVDMCGIVGVSLSNKDRHATSDLLEAALLLQHRGQDACGVVSGNTDGMVTFHRAPGLITEVFGRGTQGVHGLQGNFGIGHVRYATNGLYTNMQIQPIIARDRGNVAIAHNGNLENSGKLGSYLSTIGLNKSNSIGDSELILEMFLSKRPSSGDVNPLELVPSWMLSGLEDVYRYCAGSFACILFIPSYGLVAFRDANGIKPIIVGERRMGEGEIDYMFASESVATRNLGYTTLRDIRPGEAIFLPSNSAYAEQPRYIAQQIAPKRSYSPDIFEYVYLARAESIMDGISVNRSRQFMGEALAQTIINELSIESGFKHEEIDCIIPVPETSFICALAVSQYLHKPLSFGIARNQFIFRTFILTNQKKRSKAVTHKLSAVREEFEGRNVLIVDDSIVRGTTATQIVKMAQDAGAKKVYLASGSPAIRFKHIYGIDLADESKLIAHGRSHHQIRKALGCDGVFYLPLEGLVNSCLRARHYGDISSFEVGIFDGNYATERRHRAEGELDKLV